MMAAPYIQLSYTPRPGARTVKKRTSYKETFKRIKQKRMFIQHQEGLMDLGEA